MEGLTPEGMIRTGADRSRIPSSSVPHLRVAVDRIARAEPEASVYVYGSVATGVARSPASDLDLLAIGLSTASAVDIGREFSATFTDFYRGVEIAAAMTSDLDGDSDEAYGGRVFLHHYCVHLAGPDLDRASTAFRGDRRAARSFNGDIARHVCQWRGDAAGSDPATLGTRVARKTLLAVAGLVSVHDETWTTDRTHATQRWGQVRPELAVGLRELLEWSSQRSTADRDRLTDTFERVVDPIVHQFADHIGLWID